MEQNRNNHTELRGLNKIKNQSRWIKSFLLALSSVFKEDSVENSQQLDIEIEEEASTSTQKEVEEV